MTRLTLAGASVVAVLALAACSSDDDDADGTPTSTTDENLLPGEDVEPGDTSMFNPDLDNDEPPSAEPSGDDTSAIAGLWVADSGVEGRRDERYVDISDDGLYTDYDYRQDDIASEGNCYVITPLRLDLETGSATAGTFSVADGRTFTTTPSEDSDTLVVAFEPDTGEAQSESWSRAGAEVDRESLLPCES